MVEIGGTNPPLLVREEVKPDNRPLLPPNYVSLRQLRERRLKEEQEKEKEKEKVKQSDNYVSLRQLREQRLKEDKEKEMVKGKEKENETDNCTHGPPNYVSRRQLQEWRLKEKKEKENGREEESENRPRLPLNYVSLKQLQEQRLKEEKENEKEKEDDKVREKMIREEKGEKNSLLPPNYISLRQLRELRLQEKEEVPKARIEQTKVQKEGDEPGQIEAEINKKACDMARRLQSNCKDGCGKSSWAWEPVHPPAGASSSIGVSSVDSVFLPENAGVSHEVVLAFFDQNEDAEMKLRKKKKKKKQQLCRKKFSVKDNGEPVQGSELLMDVTDLKIGKVVNASSNATKEVTIYQNENNAVQKGKGGNVNLTKSSSLTIPVLVQKKIFKMHNGRNKGKGKEVNLSEQGSELLMDVTDLKIGKVVNASSNATKEVTIYQNENNAVQKGKGGNVNLTKSSSLTIPVLVQKKIFKMHNGRNKGKGKEVNLSEQGSELLMDVTDLKIGKVVNSSSNATKEVTIYQNENNAVQKGKGGNINLTESSSLTIPVLVQKKIFKMHNGRNKGKGKKVNLSEQNHSVVVPLSEAVKGSNGVEVIGSEIENVVLKGKGKMIDISELSYQTPCHEDAKGILGAGEVIGSENWNGKEEKGTGKNVNLPESSGWEGQTGGNWRKRNHAAGIRGRGHPRAGGFAARPAEHLRGGGSLVWVPKKSS
ncbi:uncharacterized protein LOC144551186 isoform X1 [Carex rostrata]